MADRKSPFGQDVPPISFSKSVGSTEIDSDVELRSVCALVERLREHDDGTFLHVRSVGRWCRKLALELGADAGQADFLERCGVLHDAGKAFTPLAILQKPSALSADEAAVMRRHADDGADICAATLGLERFAAIVRAHHERIDGRGYPLGLAGHQIPGEALVVAVADAFHAMISRRPYAPAKAPLEALAELERGSGTQFAPQVVAALFNVVGYQRERAMSIRRTHAG